MNICEASRVKVTWDLTLETMLSCLAKQSQVVGKDGIDTNKSAALTLLNNNVAFLKKNLWKSAKVWLWCVS